MKEKYLNRLPDRHQKRFSEIIQNENKPLKQKARTIFEYFLERHYHKHISHQINRIYRNWDKLTSFYRASDIPKTNNAVEQHFSNTIQNWSKEVSKIKTAWKAICQLLLLIIIRTCH